MLLSATNKFGQIDYLSTYVRNILFGISVTKLLKNAGKSTKPFMIRHLVFSSNKNVPEKVPERNKLKAAVNLMTLPLLELLPGLTVKVLLQTSLNIFDDVLFKAVCEPPLLQHFYFLP